VHDGDYLVALDVVAGARGPGSEALVRQASLAHRDWFEANARARTHFFDADAGCVRAVERACYDALVLSETPVAVEPEEGARVLAEALKERGLGERGEALLRRAMCAGVSLDAGALLLRACLGATRVADVDIESQVPHEQRRILERLCPEAIEVPSGRRVRLDYRADGSVHLAAKLQELFGWADTPRVGARSAPVVIDLLAPNGRSVQTTSDLRSFWQRTYPEVRKELRGRYPKHPWPDDPWTATPTARTQKRARR
jgi:ATP-dependent helicase HrpB